MARPEGGDQETEVRKDQREEDVDARRGALQGIPAGVRAVSQLLSRVAVRRSARLRVPAQGTVPAVVQQEDALPVRLPVRLGAAEALQQGQLGLGGAPRHDAHEAVIVARCSYTTIRKLRTRRVNFTGGDGVIVT